ncbi:hypothetical protein HPB50_027959 [Hyalomma asiaticum]|nr:hypothetical protein HPB50_027959 [Hyalomma asiaticum]
MITETKSTKESHDSYVGHLQEKQQALKKSPHEVHQTHENRGRRPPIPRPWPWRSAAAQRKSPITECEKHTDAKAKRVKVKRQPLLPRPIPRPRSPPRSRPWPRQRRRNLTPHLIHQNKLLTPPAESIPQPPAQVGKRSSRSSKPPPPVAKPEEPPGVWMQAAAASSEVASVPAKEEITKKTQLEEKLSRIARMAKNRLPDIPENDIRMKIDHLRSSRGGLSGLTYNEIVALVLEQFDAHAEERDEGKGS